MRSWFRELVIEFLIKRILKWTSKYLDNSADGKVSLDEIETFIKKRINLITGKDIDKYI